MRKPTREIKERRPSDSVSTELRSYILMWCSQKGNTIRKAADHFKVSKCSINRWKKLKAAGLPWHSRGRPPLLDEEAIEYVKKRAWEAYHSNSTVPYSAHGTDDGDCIQDILRTGINATCKRRGTSETGITLDRKAIRALLKLCDLSIQVTENTTAARARACTSIYMATSFVIFLSSIVKMGVIPELLINADCTRVDVELHGTVKTRKGVTPTKVKGKLTKSSPKYCGKGISREYVGIRWFPCISLKGDMGPIVLIVADETMPQDTIQVEEVPQLVNSSNNICGYDRGYIVFLKTTPRKAFFEWYVRDVVLDFVRRLRVVYQLKEDDTALFMHDGEACQGQTWTTASKGMTDIFEQEYIAVGKLGASTSGVSQPLDTGKILSSVKNSVRVQFLGCPEQRGHDTLREFVQSIIQKRKEENASSKLDGKKRVIVFGVVAILVAIRTYGKADMGVKSFEYAGISLEEGIITCDTRKILNQYKLMDNIIGDDAHKLAHYVDQCSAQADKFLALGKLSDEHMKDNISLVKELHDLTASEDLGRDSRAITQQRCVLLVGAALSQKQERLKLNEEKRRKRAKELEEKRKKANIMMGRAENKKREKQKTEVADLTAEIHRLKAELDREKARVAYEKEKNKSKTSEISRESGQKRKTSATSNSFAARDQPECSYIDDQCTNEDTPENQAVSFLSAKRGEGKRFVKQKIH